MQRLSKQEWLEQAFRVLAEVGANNLTIDTLTQHLGVTKGSFYHHFSSYQDFKLSLLALFEELGTQAIIQLSETGHTPAAKLQRLLDATTEYPLDLELQIRAWALQDEDVRVFQARIDQQRMDYVYKLYFELTGDADAAKLAAQTLYALYIGSQQLLPPIRGAALAEIYYALQNTFTQASQSKSPNPPLGESSQ